MTQSIDQAGHITVYAYDLAGRLSNVTAAFGTGDKATTIYGYNVIGQSTRFTDALGNQSTNSYDLAG